MAKQRLINISGVSDKGIAPIVGHISKEEGQSLVIVASQAKAKILASDLSFFVKKNIYVLPDEDYYFLKFEAKNNDQLMERLKALKALRTNEECIVVAPVTSAIKKTIPHKEFENKSLRLKLGDCINLESIKESLVALGYERMQIVDNRGEFSVRGGIVDIFTPDGDNPYRIEFFDEEVDSIRSFNIDTQRSIENLKYIEVYPAEQVLIDNSLFKNAATHIEKEYDKQINKLEGDAAESLKNRKYQLLEYVNNCSNIQLLENYMGYFYEDTEYLWDYMKSGSIIVDDPDRIVEFLDLRDKEAADDSQVMLSRGQLVPKDLEGFSGKKDYLKVFSEERVYVLSPFPKRVQGVDDFTDLHNLQSRNIIAFGGHMDLFITEIRSYIAKEYAINIICSTQEKVDNIHEFLEGQADLPQDKRITYSVGTITNGVDFPTYRVCYICENDIFNYKKKTKKRKDRNVERTNSQKLQSFSDLSAGDYVVHENHGIGKFIAIEKMTVQGETKDYLKIKYAGNDLLYVPVEQLDIVQKYIGSDSGSPRINKLSGGEWKVTKAKAKAAIAEMAQELIDLYATRKLKAGHAFQVDNNWQREFEDSFPFTETDDQLRSIEEIKADMERPISMDRLLCGDVGFGKTEVAARAVFKCVSEGKQAAILVPTTILANQHYYTLKERFEGFPFNVEMLSRFRNEKQQKDIITKLKQGNIDIIIGTHRILSTDVRFKDLGLLVIDEEQRFGVAHKEKIKQLKENVDVLTLSATPIPRTLNMSLTGIKDMSLIEEPPEERYPVQTYVLEQNEELIKEIINRELNRDGQVFIVYNRVKGIQRIAGMIEKLVPEANIAVGHGQMNERALEDIMLGFIQGDTNVLVATTIIESGIDIPNANTMIILEADHYGLSQLYQLRGRVGRSNRIAYAYLMYQKDKVLTELSEKRLKAIKDFTEFGAGFKVAMKDLELRGAGNLLGNQQSGHMSSIGYELYCKLVDDAVKTLQGKEVNQYKEETSVEFTQSAYIPERYIGDESLKLQMYKKIANIRDRADEEEICDELIDRFGDIPKETMTLIKISRIRALASELSVERVYPQGTKIILEFREDNPLNPYSIISINEKFGNRVFVHAGVRPLIKLSVDVRGRFEDTIKLLEIIDENKKTN